MRLENGINIALDAMGRAKRWASKLGTSKGTPAEAQASCVIIGPVASGKSALLYSLRRCQKAGSHSYTGRFDITLNSRNADFGQYDDMVVDYFRTALDFEPTKQESYARPEFAVTVTAETREKATAEDRHKTYRPGNMEETRFVTFDGSGGLLLETEEEALKMRRGQDADSYKAARKALMDDLQTCRDFIICLPIEKALSDKVENRLADYLYQFRRGDRFEGRRVVVCFTMYEKLGTNLHREAYRRLARRGEARVQMRRALTERMPGILAQLKQFHAAASREVYFAPVSTYGFIPHHGSANYDPETGLLRTTVHEKEKSRTRARPYPFDYAFQRLWYPFLTLDPFIFIATGVCQGTLIHRLDELFL
jgi:hypothetical protein